MKIDVSLKALPAPVSVGLLYQRLNFVVQAFDRAVAQLAVEVVENSRQRLLEHPSNLLHSGQLAAAGPLVTLLEASLRLGPVRALEELAEHLLYRPSLAGLQAEILHRLEAPEELLQALLSPIVEDMDHAGLAVVSDRGHASYVLMALSIALLVNADAPGNLVSHPEQASGHDPGLDRVGRAPADEQDAPRLAHRAGEQQVDGQPLEQRRESARALRPRHLKHPRPAVGILQAGHAGLLPSVRADPNGLLAAGPHH